jgi:hypothetical protein
MKNHLNSNVTGSKKPCELKISKTTSAAAKKPTYIYTEEDLGEGILNVGVSA